MILLIDNYDSFVYNLARYVSELGYHHQIVRNDAITVAEIEQLRPTHIIISPGPKAPKQAGISVEIIRHFAASTPILGVCLGHQAIAEAFGGIVTHAKRPMHGKTSLVTHQGGKLFSGLPNPLPVARYHSLIVSDCSLPECLRVTSRSEENEIMALEHIQYPMFGLQFHPESILTSHGYELLQNFLKIKK